MHAPLQPDTMRYGWSMSRQYASYRNAFLFLIILNKFKDFCPNFEVISFIKFRTVDWVSQ